MHYAAHPADGAVAQQMLQFYLRRVDQTVENYKSIVSAHSSPQNELHTLAF